MHNRIIHFTAAEINTLTPVIKEARLLINEGNRLTTVNYKPLYGNRLRVKNTMVSRLGIYVFSSQDEVDTFNGTNRYIDLQFPVKKLGGDATGLANDATAYTAQVSLAGAAVQVISIVGSTAQTITNLVAQLNVDLTGATATHQDGDSWIRITADTVASWYVAMNDTGANALAETLGADIAPEPFVPFIVDAGDLWYDEKLGRPFKIGVMRINAVAALINSILEIEVQSMAQ